MSLRLSDLLQDNQSSSNINLYETELKGTTRAELLDYMALVISRNFSKQFAFKGGWVLSKIIPVNTRSTEDVDLSIAEESDYGYMKEILTVTANFFKNKNIIDEYVIKETVTHTSSGGIKMYKNGKLILGVDVGCHDLSYGLTAYNLDICIKAFSVERMLSDKILATLTRKRFRRVKDFYDIYTLSDTFDFSSKLILKYMLERDLPIEWQNIPFSDIVIEQLDHAWNTLKILSPTSESSGYKPEFKDVLDRYKSIVYDLNRFNNNEYIWDHIKHRWC